MNHEAEQNRMHEPSSSASDIQTATLGMGCFWSPEALFGQLPGVRSTRVGYAGGTSSHPTYRQMGDHTVTVQMEFDAKVISFEEIAELFWNSHNPMNINDYKGRQYMSLLFYGDGKQQAAIQRVVDKRKKLGLAPETEIAPYSEFYAAESRHQKYYLKRHPNAMEKLSLLYPSEDELVSSTLAARLNGLAKGYTNLEHIKNEILEWPIPVTNREMMIDHIKQIRW